MNTPRDESPGATTVSSSALFQLNYSKGWRSVHSTFSRIACWTVDDSKFRRGGEGGCEGSLRDTLQIGLLFSQHPSPSVPQLTWKNGKPSVSNYVFGGSVAKTNVCLLSKKEISQTVLNRAISRVFQTSVDKWLPVVNTHCTTIASTPRQTALKVSSMRFRLYHVGVHVLVLVVIAELSFMIEIWPNWSGFLFDSTRLH